MGKPKYEIRRGFRAPTPSLPSTDDTAVYEVWRRRTLFQSERHIQTFNRRSLAEASCRCLNG